MDGNQNVRYNPDRRQAGVFRLPSSNPFVKEYWHTVKEAGTNFPFKL
ncbi:hypothetical protein M3O96_07035 [Aquiflexum sp. TKW24L]|nr:hypothetical protein [Aquiflexum sp. TKW24L]MCL6258832.1 hypothetical protein [Aquiflexum sp. TKW24L]